MSNIFIHDPSVSTAISQVVATIPQLEDKLPYFGYNAGKSSLALFYYFQKQYTGNDLLPKNRTI